MGLILNLIYWFLNIFLFALIARLILDYVRMFKPDWRPKGAVLARQSIRVEHAEAASHPEYSQVKARGGASSAATLCAHTGCLQAARIAT